MFESIRLYFAKKRLEAQQRKAKEERRGDLHFQALEIMADARRPETHHDQHKRARQVSASRTLGASYGGSRSVEQQPDIMTPVLLYGMMADNTPADPNPRKDDPYSFVAQQDSEALKETAPYAVDNNGPGKDSEPSYSAPEPSYSSSSDNSYSSSSDSSYSSSSSYDSGSSSYDSGSSSSSYSE